MGSRQGRGRGGEGTWRGLDLFLDSLGLFGLFFRTFEQLLRGILLCKAIEKSIHHILAVKCQRVIPQVTKFRKPL